MLLNISLTTVGRGFILSTQSQNSPSQITVTYSPQNEVAAVNSTLEVSSDSDNNHTVITTPRSEVSSFNNHKNPTWENLNDEEREALWDDGGGGLRNFRRRQMAKSLDN